MATSYDSYIEFSTTFLTEAESYDSYIEFSATIDTVLPPVDIPEIVSVSNPEISVYDISMNRVAIVDDYEYFRWESNWYTLDTWTLFINRYKPNADYFLSCRSLDDNNEWTYGGFIGVNLGNGYRVGLMESIQLGLTSEGKVSEQFQISGRGVEGILGTRIILNGTELGDGYDTQNTEAETAMRHYVLNNCITPGTATVIGGGEGYPVYSAADAFYTTVRSAHVLVTVLANIEAWGYLGRIIWIPGDATIDMTGRSNVHIPAGTTIASDRGYNGSDGALIKRDRIGGESACPFSIIGNNVRITGIRLVGDSSAEDSADPYFVGLTCGADDGSTPFSGLNIDNCEICNWPVTGIQLNNTVNAWIHHNYIHNCAGADQGHGVRLSRGSARIEANIFDYTRHAFHADGYDNEVFEFRYNHHEGNGSCATGCHVYVADLSGNAGYTSNIHHNTFDEGDLPSIGLMEKPVLMCYINHNVMHTSADTLGGEPVFQDCTVYGNLRVLSNYWDSDLIANDAVVLYT